MGDVVDRSDVVQERRGVPLLRGLAQGFQQRVDKLADRGGVIALDVARVTSPPFR